ncbi:MAG: Holliday junction resolvase RuvX [Planctomycetota bacterium]|jgi:putative Holliday junction resolvase
MRYLAVDHGTKRTGLAICDPGETIVSPLAVIEGQQGLIEMIARTVANMDDSAGPQAKLVLKFAERLENVLDIPVHFQDERLSTFGAEDKLAAAELTKKKKKKHLDAIAAAEILETFLQDKNR